jgi:hypothetical protein
MQEKQDSPLKIHINGKAKLAKSSMLKKAAAEDEERKTLEKKSHLQLPEAGFCSPLKDPSLKKSQRDPLNSTLKSQQPFREASSNSPQKQKTLLKSPRDLNDIDIDKESLMQLNRATNQFFSKKVKETIQNSMLFQKPGSSERRSNNNHNNSSLDETTFSIKSLDHKEKSSPLKDYAGGFFY